MVARYAIRNAVIARRGSHEHQAARRGGGDRDRHCFAGAGQRAQQQRQQSPIRPTTSMSAAGMRLDPDPNIRAQLQRRQPGGSW